MIRWILLIPLLVFLGLSSLLLRGLFLDPAALPSALIDKPFPEFSLRQVGSERVMTRADLLGRPALVNVWATWCVACRAEHPVLNRLAARGVVIHGINYKDDDAQAQKWLKEFHNPYTFSIRDDEGRLGMDLGVYGAPETFLIDSQGIIRHKFVGVIDDQVWHEQLAARYQALVDEARP